MRLLPILFLCFACVGCEQHYVEVSEARLHQLVDSTEKDGAADWVYLGTDDRWHYFARRYYWTAALLGPPFGPQTRFKISWSDFRMEDIFRPAKDERGASVDRLVFRRWIPRRMNDGTIDYDLVFDFYSRSKIQDTRDLAVTPPPDSGMASSQPASAASP
jgi:hypothetical protein